VVKGIGRRIGAIVMALGLALTGVAVSTETAHAEDLGPVERFANCIRSVKKADVAMLIDESGSLAYPWRDASGKLHDPTDPDDTRVDALLSYLDTLGRLTETEDNGLGAEVNVQLFGFSVDSAQRTTWISAADGLPELKAQAAAFADRDRGNGTDYYLGLDAARQSLAKRHTADPETCQALVFFSDGALDIQPRDSYDDIDRPYAEGVSVQTAAGQAQATKQAEEALCVQGGLADQLHSQGVYTFGVGLSPEGDASTFKLMQAVVEGAGCGSITGQGYFVAVKGIDDLLHALRSLDGGTTPLDPLPLCQQGRICDEGSYWIALDESLNSVGILATGRTDAVQIWLVSPDGTETQIGRDAVNQSGDLGVPGVNGSRIWRSQRTVDILMKRKDSTQWSGVWQLALVVDGPSEATSLASFQVKGDLQPVLANPEVLTSIEKGQDPVELRLGLEHDDGQSVELATLTADATIDWEVVSQGQRQSSGSVAKSNLSTALALSVDTLPIGDSQLNVTLNVTTNAVSAGGKQHSTKLEPTGASYPITVVLPPEFPTVADATLDFGSIEGPAEVSREMSTTGPGCVWLAGAELQAFPGGEVPTLTSDHSSAETCLSLAEGETKPLVVTLKVPAVNAGLSGLAKISLASADDLAAPQDVVLRVTAEVSRPADPTRFYLALILAVILGVGIPLILLYAFKALFNSKIPPGVLHALSFRMRVSESSVTRDGGPVTLQPGDFRDIVSIGDRGTRSTSAAGYQLHTRLGLSPFGAGHVVSDLPGQLVATSVNPSPARDKAQLPLALDGTWVISADPAAVNGRGGEVQVLVFTAAQETRRREEVLRTVAAAAPSVLRAFAESSAGEGGSLSSNDRNDGSFTPHFEQEFGESQSRDASSSEAVVSDPDYIDPNEW
jgi:hypothetical protein